MVLHPGLQIYLQPCVTLNFDLLTPKLDHFMPLSHRPLVSISKIGLFVFKISCSKVWQHNGWMNELTHEYNASVWPGGIEMQYIISLTKGNVIDKLHVGSKCSPV